MFHLDPNGMVERDLALREHELRRNAERARLRGDLHGSRPTTRVLAKALRRTLATLTALARRSERRHASVQEGCA